MKSCILFYKSIRYTMAKRLHISNIVRKGEIEVHPPSQEVLNELGIEWQKLTEDLESRSKKPLLLNELLEQSTDVTDFSYGDTSNHIVTYLSPSSQYTIKVYKKGVHVMNLRDKAIDMTIFSTLNVLIGLETREEDIIKYLLNLSIP